MKKYQIYFILIVSLIGFSFSASEIKKENRIDNYKLKSSDLPEGYIFTPDLNCKSIQPLTFYKQAESLYGMILGEIEFKDFQSFKGKKDEGTILYFQFKEKFEGDGFLNGYLWGEKDKATKQHPEEFLVTENNILIIWSTDLDSKIKSISKLKIKQ